jgi:hypothetical protein
LKGYMAAADETEVRRVQAEYYEAD